MTDKKKFFTKKKGIVIAVIALLIIVAAAFYLWMFVDVKTETVSRGHISDHYTCEGVIENGGSYHITSEVDGRVIGFYVKENDVVEADTVIAKIDPSDIQRSLAAARAGAGGSAVSSAKTAYEIAKALYEAGGGSRLEYENARAEYQKASAEYADQAALIASLESQLEKCTIKAGKAGIVSALPGKDLSAVDAGTEVAVINCEGRPSVKLDVLTNIAPYISAGDEVDVTIALKGKDEHYSGKVSEVYNYASSGISALGLAEYRVRVNVDLDSDPMLVQRDGYGANIKFCIYDRDDVLSVPSSAIFTADGQQYVYRKEGTTAVAVPVTVEYNSSSRAVISEGLSEGDEVVVYSNTPDLEDGAYIR
jgi:HlyD family secretion protein